MSADRNATNEELIHVATFADPSTGNIARSALEAADIPVFLQGENANSLLPVAFESQLFVRSADEAAAHDILSGFTEAPSSLEDVTAAEESGD